MDGLRSFVEGKSVPEFETKDLGEIQDIPQDSTKVYTMLAAASTPGTNDPAPAGTTLQVEKNIAADSDQSGVDSVQEISSGTGGSIGSREQKLYSTDGALLQEKSSFATRELFSRACHFIREALDLDGVAFIDAYFRDIDVDPIYKAPTSPQSDQFRYQGIPESPTSDKSSWLEGLQSGRKRQGSFASASKSLENSRSSSSDVLGFSVKSNVGFGNDSTSSNQVPLQRSVLRNLLRRYRRGHIFVFDEDGCVVHTADESPQSETVETLSERESVKIWSKQLLEICPGARSIIFFPLWDPQRDQWFAGGLAWTADNTRTIQAADITYLAAFGSCIMSEKSRIDALTADRAKADFISSVSHELRSPLHGILASAEELQDISTNLAQEDMVQTITVCGEALLDTLDQM